MVATAELGRLEKTEPGTTPRSQALLAEIRMLLDAYHEGYLPPIKRSRGESRRHSDHQMRNGTY